MIKVKCVNLESRNDRRIHGESEISGRPEFEMRIFKAIRHEVGSVGLWKSLISVVQEMSRCDDEYFIFCEDDHVFTDRYSPELLRAGIEQAIGLNADILLGGVSWLETAVQVSDKLFWVDKYTGNQFMVIFRKFYATLLEITDFEKSSADRRISELSDNKFVIFPFISIQKEFGYSDATTKNNRTGRVDYLFDTTVKKLSRLDKVRNYYMNLRQNDGDS